MTQERYEALQPFSGVLYTAAYASFIRLTDSKAKAVLEKLYTDEFGHSGNILGGCNRCVLNALAKLGKAYFAFEKMMKEVPKETVEEAVDLNNIVGKEPEPTMEVIENKQITKPVKKTAAKKSKKK